MFARALRLIPLLLAISCAKPAINAPPVPIEKISNVRAKVSFQPAPPPFPCPLPPNVSEARVSVRMIISGQGQVIQIQPVDGEEPFLSTVAKYASKWRFEASEFEYRQAVLTMIYNNDKTISLKIA